MQPRTPMRVQCANCDRVLKIPKESLPAIFQCPKCKEKMRIELGYPEYRDPEPKPPPPQPVAIKASIAPPDTKMCPFCRSQIAFLAVKCPHCQEFVDEKWRAHLQKQRDDGRISLGVAALLSFVIPGAGQAYKGDVALGVCLFFGTLIGYAAFIIPGIAIHVFAVIEAATSKP